MSGGRGAAATVGTEIVIVRWQDGLRWKLKGYTFEFENALDALRVGLELADAARDVLAALDVERKEDRQ